MRFTQDMSIYEALQAHPRAREVFVAHGMGCSACMASTAETIANGARMHGVEADALIDELNRLPENDAAPATASPPADPPDPVRET